MLLDALNLFADAQSMVSGTGNLLCEQSIDLGTAGIDSMGNTVIKDLGRGESPEVFAQIIEAVDSAGGAATVQAQLVMADDGPLGTNLVVLQETAAIPEATLIPGYQFRFNKVPVGVTKEFLGMRLVIAGEAVTAGKLTAGLAINRQSNPVV